MDFKNSPKKVRRVSAISQKNRDQVSKNKKSCLRNQAAFFVLCI